MNKKSLFGIALPGPSPNPYFQSVDPVESEGLLSSKNKSLKDQDVSGNTVFDTSKVESILNNVYLDVYRDENICLIASYFTVGFALFFSPSPIYYYLVEVLNTSSTEIGVFVTVETIPWSLKVFYGLLSDTLPILGYRRKPYILIGWMIFILGNFILALLGKPSTLSVISWGFFCMNGLLLADVCNDTMSVERAKLETEETRGNLQTTCYIFRGLGMVIGSVFGATLYNRSSWGWGLTISQIFLLNCILPLITIGWTFQSLIELSPIDTDLRFSVQVQNVWNTLQLRAVWKPMAFIYTYNVFQVPNSAWSNYLIQGLDFSDFDIGLLRIAAAVMTYSGLIVYKQYFFNAGWQSIYIYTTIIGVFFSFMQLLLIYQVNEKLGIPNLAFSLGDTTFGKKSSS
jgi:MFS family permease